MFRFALLCTVSVVLAAWPTPPALAQGDDLLFSDKPAAQDKTAPAKPKVAPGGQPGKAVSKTRDDEARMDEVKTLIDNATGSEYCARALDVYKSAAGRGNARAQYNLGVFAQNGDCLPKDLAAAAAWYEKAAAGGDATAMAQLGMLAVQGLGMPQDTQRGLGLLAQAAARGESQAEYSLGQFAQFALYGVPKDYQAARAHLERAAQAGSTRALYNLSILYREGQGVPVDESRSFALCRECALLGDCDCQIDLGWHFSNGRGTRVDQGQAYFWTCLALANPKINDNGRAVAQDNKAKTAQTLSAAQAAHIEALVRATDPRKPQTTGP